MTWRAANAELTGAIDWQQPWFESYRRLGRSVSEALRSAGSVAEALCLAAQRDSLFVPAERLPAGQAYEAFIDQTRRVPTRDNLHDLFNGLVWLAFPRTKRRLNQLQAAELARAGIGATRGPLRDALTVFDENGALLQAPDALWDALVARDWRRLFVDLRPLWQEARLVPFGHALLEKLVRPRKAITAHVLRVPAGSIDRSDLAAQELLDSASLVLKPFQPLPVLGVPGWWPENRNTSFYDDADVFRSSLNRSAAPPIAEAGSAGRSRFTEFS